MAGTIYASLALTVNPAIAANITPPGTVFLANPDSITTNADKEGGRGGRGEGEVSGHRRRHSSLNGSEVMLQEGWGTRGARAGEVG